MNQPKEFEEETKKILEVFDKVNETTEKLFILRDQLFIEIDQAFEQMPDNVNKNWLLFEIDWKIKRLKETI